MDSKLEEFKRKVKEISDWLEKNYNFDSNGKLK